MNSTDTLQGTFKNDREQFLDKLSSFVILDIGTVTSVDMEGKARIISSTFINDKPVIYEDAEVIYPGNANGTYATDCTGMACLIFAPRSCMPNVSDLKLHIGATSYTKDGVKAFPIGNGVANKVKTLFSADGCFNLFGQVYSISFTEDSITYSMNNGTTSITIDETGQVYLTYQVNEGTYSKSIEKTGVTTTWLSQDKDVLWTDTYNPDGSRSFVQSDPDDEEGDPLFSITIDNTGAATIGMKKGLTLETKDSLSLKAKSVAIESTGGKVEVKSSDDTTITSSKKVTIDTDDDTTITSSKKVAISSTNNTTIDCSKFAVNNTNLEVE